MKTNEIHKFLAEKGIRVFVISLGADKITLIHPNKTVKQWRADILRIKSELNSIRDNDGYANDKIYNKLNEKLFESGYFDIEDIVSDVYEGRIKVCSTSIEDDPAHEEQVDGFGHYGIESKNEI